MNYPFLERIADPDVRRRAKKVLCAMELLSENSAAPMGYSTPSSEPDRLPRGIAKRSKVAQLGKPGRDRPLFERYLYAFSFAERGETRPDPAYHYSFLTACAERDYRYYTEGLPPDAEAGSVSHIGDAQGRDGAKVEAEKGDELVRHYEGVIAAEVAMVENVRIQWVWKARKQRGRDEETGHPLPGWRGWNHEQRFNRVQTLKTRRDKRTGKLVTQDWVAAELGTSRSAVQRYWERMPRQEAA